MTRSWHYGALGVALTVLAGFIARRTIMAEYSFGGRFFAVAVWVVAAGVFSAGAVAFAAPRRPYVLGLLTGLAGVMATGVILFWREANLFWVMVALVVAVLVGAVGAFLGITLRWLLGNGRLPA